MLCILHSATLSSITTQPGWRRKYTRRERTLCVQTGEERSVGEMVGSGLHQGLSGPGLVELHTAAQAEGPAQPSLGVQRGHTLKLRHVVQGSPQKMQK